MVDTNDQVNSTEERATTRLRPELSGALRRVVTGIVAFLAVSALAVVGYLIAGWSFGDSLYMAVITIFGVGYGEVVPIDSVALRALTIVVIVAGYGAVVYTVGGLIQMFVDGELNRVLGERRMSNEIDRMSGHTIICGFGRMGMSLAHDLAEVGQPFVAIDSDQHMLSRGDHDFLVIVGDATEEQVLEAAGIARASTLATVLSDDATNVFVTLTARSMNPDMMIVARGENIRTESKLLTCGADQVVLPTSIGATRMTQMITRPTAEQMLDQIAQLGSSGMGLGHLGLEFDEIMVGPDSPFLGKTLGDVEVRGAHGYLVIGVRHRDGETIMHPGGEVELELGDTLVLLGYHDDIPQLADKLGSTATPMTYRGRSL